MKASNWVAEEEDWCRAVQLIQEEEKTRIEKFSYQADCKASLIGRLLLRAFCLRHLPASFSNTSLHLTRTQRGKPIVEGTTVDHEGKQHCSLLGSTNYNVSHAGKWVVLAGGNGRLGVDLMQTKDSRIDRLDNFFRLMRGQFTEAEWLVIRSGEKSPEDQLAAFFRNWTLKESFVKAVGTGLNLDLQTLDFKVESDLENDKVEVCTKLIKDNEETSWRFEESFLDEEHIVSVCTESSTDEEPFTVLTMPQLLGMFDNAQVFRPRDPADFLLYDGKLKTKPF